MNTHLQRMNLNQHVLFIPTEFGFETLKAVYPKRMESWNFRHLDDRYIKMQMWDFMSVFGKYMWNGTTFIPVKDMTIYVEVENEYSELKTFSI